MQPNSVIPKAQTLRRQTVPEHDQTNVDSNSNFPRPCPCRCPTLLSVRDWATQPKPSVTEKLKWPILQFRPVVVVVVVAGHFPAAAAAAAARQFFYTILVLFSTVNQRGGWGPVPGGARNGLNSRRFVCFRLFFEAFLNGLFMRGRSIIHTLYKAKRERGARRVPGRPDQTGTGRKRGQDMRAKRKCAHLFILFRFRFDFSAFLFSFFFLLVCLFGLLCAPLLLLLNEIFKWFARKSPSGGESDRGGSVTVWGRQTEAGTDTVRRQKGP